MDALLVASVPISPVKADRSTTTDSTYSLLSSVPEEYFTPQPSVRRSRTSSDSDTISSEHSLSDDSDYKDCLSTASVSRHVRFAVSPKPQIHIQVSIVNDEAEFFAVVTPKDAPDINTHEQNQTSKVMGKRDKIRALFNKKFHPSNSDVSESSGGDWNEVLAKALISVHRDIEGIITGLDDVDQPAADTVPADTSQHTLAAPRLSFAERQRGKLQLMRMAQMLHPPSLLTYDVKESPYPYTDIISPLSVELPYIGKNLLFERLLIQHRPFRHKKFRYRTQRCLLRLRRDIKKLKQDIYGGETLKSHQELPSLAVQNYRNRLEKTLLEVRSQIAEYDRVHSLDNQQRPSISQIITKLKGLDPITKARIADYRTKLRPVSIVSLGVDEMRTQDRTGTEGVLIFTLEFYRRTSEYIEKGSTRELISAPFIPRRSRCRPISARPNTSSTELVDKRFDPATFVDLTKEAESFFDDHKPFWDRPTDTRSSISSAAASARRLSNRPFLPSKTGIWDRFIFTFKAKQKMLKDAELAETVNEHDDEFLTFPSLSMPQKEIESSTVFSADQNKVH